MTEAPKGTPQEQAAVKQKHEVMATRDEMHQKQEAARREADEMVRKNGGTNPVVSTHCAAISNP